MKDFYVQLLSNASTGEFTDNKANSFKNRLPYPLLFESDKEWKVGLASVSYPIPPSRPHQVPVPQAHDFGDDDYVFGIEWSGPLKRSGCKTMVLRGVLRDTAYHSASPGRN